MQLKLRPRMGCSQWKAIPRRHKSSTPPRAPTRGTTPHLHGKTALITGASRGIGRAIATRFASEGARCILVGRQEDSLRSVLSTLARYRPDTAEGTEEERAHDIRVGNVADAAFWKGVVRGEGKVGRVDVLVNGAGLTHYSPLFVTAERRVDEVVDVNLKGTVWGCRAVGKEMLRGGEGTIINIASLLGLRGGKGSAVYAASKAAIVGLTRALAAELGPSGIRVNAIVPGYILTDMTDAMTPVARTTALNAVPLSPPRFGDAPEIADAAVFLATNQYANNCVLNLDGGLSAL